MRPYLNLLITPNSEKFMKKQLFPVMKNGKFFGFADKDQIENNKSLSVYEEQQQPEQAEPVPQFEGAHPSQVKRRRGRPPKNEV